MTAPTRVTNLRKRVGDIIAVEDPQPRGALVDDPRVTGEAQGHDGRGGRQALSIAASPSAGSAALRVEGLTVFACIVV